MTEEVAIESLKGTVFVGRKVSDGNYGSYDFGVHLPVSFDPTLGVTEQLTLVKDAFEDAKAILAVQTEPVLANLVEKSFVAPSGPKSAPVQRAASSGPAATATVFCNTCGTDVEAYDNTAKIAAGIYKSTAPKYKGKACKHGIWSTPKAANDDPHADEPF